MQTFLRKKYRVSIAVQEWADAQKSEEKILFYDDTDSWSQAHQIIEDAELEMIVREDASTPPPPVVVVVKNDDVKVLPRPSLPLVKEHIAEVLAPTKKPLTDPAFEKAKEEFENAKQKEIEKGKNASTKKED